MECILYGSRDGAIANPLDSRDGRKTLFSSLEHKAVITQEHEFLTEVQASISYTLYENGT